MNWGWAVPGFLILVGAMAAITTAYDSATDINDQSVWQTYRAKYTKNFLVVAALVLAATLAVVGLILFIRGVANV